MKTLIAKITLLATIIFLLAIKTNAQDVVKTNPKYTKVLTDTAGVRMIKVTLAPGEQLAMHTHPVQMVYCLEGGQLTITYKSGKKETVDIKAGDSLQTPADPPHMTRNSGSTTISFLEIEIASLKLSKK
jgi:quercetin dioxygenase-like cupin family protein